LTFFIAVLGNKQGGSGFLPVYSLELQVLIVGVAKGKITTKKGLIHQSLPICF